jgi:hypothetical protein
MLLLTPTMLGSLLAGVALWLMFWYGVNHVDSNGTVHAGCHIVSWDEIERIAPEIEEYEPRIKCNQCQNAGHQ